MFARVVATALVVLAAATSAGATAQQGKPSGVPRGAAAGAAVSALHDFRQRQRAGRNGTVTLVGKVTMPYKKNDIERRVSKLPSVDRLVNRIEVLPVSQFDDDLRFRIARAIYSNPNFRPSRRW